MISRRDADELSLAERIAMEVQITDERAKTELPVVPDGWTFDVYASHNPWRRRMFAHLGPLEGRKILDVGCGWHPTPLYFALAGAEVVATEISAAALDYVQRSAERHGVADRITTQVCPAEAMPFDDDAFDLVHGEGLLHHLVPGDAGREISRVLKPGGRGAFKDPFGQNPVLEFARDHLPYAWKGDHKGTDHPLTEGAIAAFGAEFRSHSWSGFGLTAVVATAATRRRRTGLVEKAEALDDRIIRALPRLEGWCRFVTVCVEN